MKEITVTRYQTLDGKIFDTMSDAIHHEKEIGQIDMYDWHGNKTSLVDEAVVVNLGEYEHPAGNVFVALAEQQNSPIAGIEYSEDPEEADCGWFYFDDFENKYVYLPSDIVDILRKVL